MGMRIEGTEAECVTALIADDHRLFRFGLRTMLEHHGIQVVGDAANGADAVDLAQRLDPDVVIMDLAMPGLDGVEATRRIVASGARARVLVLTGSDGTQALEALIAGAAGYLVKDSGLDRIADAVHAAARGESALCPRVAGRLVERLRALEAAHDTDRRFERRPALTPREAEVLRLVSAGRDNHAIGESLYISPSTVKHHVTAILHKLGVQNRVQAAVEAVRIGVA
jgi:DNA-binding NarL/FixJ family response regulator